MWRAARTAKPNGTRGPNTNKSINSPVQRHSQGLGSVVPQLFSRLPRLPEDAIGEQVRATGLLGLVAEGGRDEVDPSHGGVGKEHEEPGPRVQHFIKC